MTNEERDTALYQKMFAEQESFRDWLKGQPPEEILNHAYEYTIRKRIGMIVFPTAIEIGRKPSPSIRISMPGVRTGTPILS